MRPIYLVIKAMKTKIPFEFNSRGSLLDRLDEISYSAAYTAPEAMSIRWDEIAEALTVYLGEPDNWWKKEVAMIFANELDYREFINEEDHQVS